MSRFLTPVVQFELVTHPNADSLSIAKIKGWQCVVRTEDFINEALGVYIPLDAVTDADHPLLSFMEGKKVKTIRLRQVISQGILLPLSKVIEYINTKFNLNTEFSDYEQGFDTPVLSKLLGIKKWEPVKNSNKGTSVPDFMELKLPSVMLKYTDIENVKNFPNTFTKGEKVFVTEKLHGTSARFGLIGGQFYIGSRNRGLRTENFTSEAGNLMEIRKTTWHEVAERENIPGILQKIAEAFVGQDVILFGEIVGAGIQDLTYGHDVPTFYAYDIALVDGDGFVEFLTPDNFQSVVNSLNIRAVPLLAYEDFSEETLNYRSGETTLNGAKHVREGVIIEPEDGRLDYRFGRVIMKAISEEYLMRKGATDF